MAKIGVRNFLYGILTEDTDGTATYGEAKKPAKAISCKVDITNNSAELYADDGLAESDKTFGKADVTLGVDDEDDKIYAELLGHTISEEGEMVRNANDTAPYVGFGRILTKVVNNQRKYKVEFLKKVKFEEPSQDEETKGEQISFKTGELKGTASTLKNGDWSATQTFDTFEKAETYLKNFFKKAE